MIIEDMTDEAFEEIETEATSLSFVDQCTAAIKVKEDSGFFDQAPTMVVHPILVDRLRAKCRTRGLW